MCLQDMMIPAHSDRLHDHQRLRSNLRRWNFEISALFFKVRQTNGNWFITLKSTFL